MRSSTGPVVAGLVACMLALVAWLPADARIAGGGPAASDCYAEWDGVTATRGQIGVDCQDGDTACDQDGQADGGCTFGVGVCAAGDDVPGCTPPAVSAIQVPRRLLRTGGSVLVPLVPPATPATAPTCGTAALVRLPLRGRTKRRASKPVKLRMTASTSDAVRPKRDVDRLTLRCLPNAGRGVCPENPAGGPRELSLTVGSTGTDLDIGWLGVAHNLQYVAGATLRVCATDCDPTTDSSCALAGDTGAGTINGPAFGPPLPTFVIGTATCLVNRFDGPVTGTADLATGALDLALHLATDVYVAPSTIVCPQCSGDALGDTGVCQDGPDKGKACRVEGVTRVAEAGKTFTLSSACRPSGTRVATLMIPVQVTTGTRTLTGPTPCPAQLEDDSCAGGSCTAACTGSACATQLPDPADPSTSVCVATQGGLSQVCCSNDPTLPCFPTAGGGTVTRVGRAVPPAPAWPDPTYPKTADEVVVDIFCEPATGQNVLDAITTGLPGPAAVTLPIRACWLKDGHCP